MIEGSGDRDRDERRSNLASGAVCSTHQASSAPSGDIGPHAVSPEVPAEFTLYLRIAEVGTKPSSMSFLKNPASEWRGWYHSKDSITL